MKDEPISLPLFQVKPVAKMTVDLKITSLPPKKGAYLPHVKHHMGGGF
jgi:hypothetical protein